MTRSRVIIRNGRAQRVPWPRLKSGRRRGVVALAFLLFFLFLVSGGLSAEESAVSLSVTASSGGTEREDAVAGSLGQTTQYYSPGQLISPIPLTYLASDKKGATSAGVKSAKPVFSLGRFVTLSVGTFPFAYFYTNFVFDIAKFAMSGFDTTYAPWPFNSDSSSTVTTSEHFIRLGVSAGLCLAVGVFDIFLPHDW